jgi:predicted alpha-1,6-mannanase (GH76 family)
MKFLLFCSLSLASAQTLADITSAYNQLTTYYNYSSGLFGDFSVGIPFWTTANAIETISNYYTVSKDSSVFVYLENSYVKLRESKRYCNCYRDDQLWYVLAWARAYEVFQNVTYLQQSEEIYANLVGPYQAWNTTCGGMNWYSKSPYRNAITNELFLAASTKLHLVTGSNTPVSNFSYADWALVEWTWLNSTSMYQPGKGLFMDGLPQNNCSVLAPAVGAIWTYNQGVILDALARMEIIFGDPSYSAFAYQIASSSFTYFNGGNADNVMREISCSANGSCGGIDGQMFKGVFIRHLMYAKNMISQGDSAKLASINQWISTQTNSIFTVGSTITKDGLLSISDLWQGPYDTKNKAPYVAQGSGLDALLAGYTP